MCLASFLLAKLSKAVTSWAGQKHRIQDDETFFSTLDSREATKAVRGLVKQGLWKASFILAPLLL